MILLARAALWVLANPHVDWGNYAMRCLAWLAVQLVS